MDSGFPPGLSRRVAAAGRVPLAVAVVDRGGLVSHWSTGARRLFGPTAQEAAGRQAADLMPVAGGLATDETGLAHGGEGPDEGEAPVYPAAGRATLSAAAGARTDVLWWAYPLKEAAGPGAATGSHHAAGDGHLVLAADARRLSRGGSLPSSCRTRVMPGFARSARFPEASSLAARLPYILPAMGRAEAARITERVLELGYPVLEFSPCRQVPVTPVRYVPRQAARIAPGPHAASR
ncbi:hypothetical protein [Streptomyces sp. DW26H14]|uniref:hypothetical protein n=1 Tax=Streptomyces sp. DW26H14 TaxID=3435395 RepID=UPI00403D8C74